jgi:hypothetical protein
LLICTVWCGAPGFAASVVGPEPPLALSSVLKNWYAWLAPKTANTRTATAPMMDSDRRREAGLV